MALICFLYGCSGIRVDVPLQGDRVGENWTLYRPAFCNYYFLIPYKYSHKDLPLDNYLKLDIIGGVVPSNFLAISNPTSDSNFFVISYVGEILEVKLDPYSYKFNEDFFMTTRDNSRVFYQIELLDLMNKSGQELSF